MQKQSSQWLIPLLLAAGAAAALWYYWVRVSGPQPEAEPAATAPPVMPQSLDAPGPLHPIESETVGAAESRELVPLPPLDQSDEYFRLELTDVFGSTLEEMLAETRLIERLVATIDNLPRDRVSERIRPLGRLEDPFLVEAQDSSGDFYISQDNYRRYDALVTIATSTDLQTVVELYRRYYPLFQSAYVGLGYPDGYFNDRLVEVIDHLLETPEVSDPIALVRPHVLYEYRDADLEALSGGQKLLLRMGTDNASRIKATLRRLRELVTSM